MQVVDIFTNGILFSHTDQITNVQSLLEMAVGCNKAGYGRDTSGKEQLFGDPTEIGLLQFAESLGCKKSEIERLYSIVTEFPFDSERKRMSIVRNHGEFIRSYVKGAPERIMELVTNELLN